MMTRQGARDEVTLSLKDWIGLAGLGTTVAITCWVASVNVSSRITALEERIKAIEGRQVIAEQYLMFGKFPRFPAQEVDPIQ